MALDLGNSRLYLKRGHFGCVWNRLEVRARCVSQVLVTALRINTIGLFSHSLRYFHTEMDARAA